MENGGSDTSEILRHKKKDRDVFTLDATEQQGDLQKNREN